MQKAQAATTMPGTEQVPSKIIRVRFETQFCAWNLAAGYLHRKASAFNRTVKASPKIRVNETGDAKPSKRFKIDQGERLQVTPAAVEIGEIIMSLCRMEVERMMITEPENYRFYAEQDYFPIVTSRAQIALIRYYSHSDEAIVGDPTQRYDYIKRLRSDVDTEGSEFQSRKRCAYSHLLTLSQPEFGFILSKHNTSGKDSAGKWVLDVKGRHNFILHVSKAFLTAGGWKMPETGHQTDDLPLFHSSPTSPEILIPGADFGSQHLGENLSQSVSISKKQDFIINHSNRAAFQQKLEPELVEEDKTSDEKKVSSASFNDVDLNEKNNSGAPAAAWQADKVHVQAEVYKLKMYEYAERLANMASASIWAKAKRIRRQNGIHRLKNEEKALLKHQFAAIMLYIMNDPAWQKRGVKSSLEHAYRACEIVLSMQMRSMRKNQALQIYAPHSWLSLATNQDGSWTMAKNSFIWWYTTHFFSEYDRLLTLQYKKTRLTNYDGVVAIARQRAYQVVDNIACGKWQVKHDEPLIINQLGADLGWICMELKRLGEWKAAHGPCCMYRDIINQVYGFEFDWNIFQRQYFEA